jgi:hypothetical protein
MAHKGGVLFVWIAEKMAELQDESGKMVEWCSGVTRGTALAQLKCIQETAWIDSGDANKFYCGVLYEEE